MVPASKKRPAVLRDDKVEDCLLGSKCEESLSDSECDSENELDDCAILDIVVDGDTDQDYIIQDFVWEDMNNCKVQRENSTDSFCNSPCLARTLKTVHKIDYVGTLKLNGKNVPEKVKDAKLKKGEKIVQHCSVSVTKWCVKKKNHHYDFDIPVMTSGLLQ
jgi:hypothetical protein